MPARDRPTALLAAGIVMAVASIASAGSAAAAPTCFGAAARDHQHPCSNLTRSVVPAPAAADLVTSSSCRPVHEKPEPVCTFGASEANATGHVALVGDSHALHWRAALDVAAQAERWQGFSITAPGCFFSEAVNDLPDPARGPCVRWYRSVLAWFGRHPEVSTVFVSQNATTPVVVPSGQTALGVKTAGFRRAWKALPASVKHVIVIRDTPVSSDATLTCVRRVMAAGTERPGPACSIRRSAAVSRDPAVTAVQRPRSKRYRYVDLTEFFCNRWNCYPVVGGVLVHRDAFGHITVAYSRTLGPFLDRRVRRLMASW